MTSALFEESFGLRAFMARSLRTAYDYQSLKYAVHQRKVQSSKIKRTTEELIEKTVEEDSKTLLMSKLFLLHL
jgi:hypothetical protein